MIKTQILLQKTVEGNRRLRLGLGLGFVCFKLVPTDPWCKMLRDFTWTEKI